MIGVVGGDAAFAVGLLGQTAAIVRASGVSAVEVFDTRSATERVTGSDGFRTGERIGSNLPFVAMNEVPSEVGDFLGGGAINDLGRIGVGCACPCDSAKGFDLRWTTSASNSWVRNEFIIVGIDAGGTVWVDDPIGLPGFGAVIVAGEILLGPGREV